MSTLFIGRQSVRRKYVRRKNVLRKNVPVPIWDLLHKAYKSGQIRAPS